MHEHCAAGKNGSLPAGVLALRHVIVCLPMSSGTPGETARPPGGGGSSLHITASMAASPIRHPGLTSLTMYLLAHVLALRFWHSEPKMRLSPAARDAPAIPLSHLSILCESSSGVVTGPPSGSSRDPRRPEKYRPSPGMSRSGPVGVHLGTGAWRPASTCALTLS